LAFAILSVALSASGTEIFPGHITDPFGRQADMVAQYNPVRDEYLLGYSNGRALVGHLSPSGVFSNQTIISANTGVASMELQYNPDRDEFLYVWRNSDSSIRARYLTSDGNPIGTEFGVGSGKQPHLAYSPDSERYVVTFADGGFNINYKVINGDSTAVNPIIKSGVVASGNALSDGIAYGSVAKKFLIAYVRDWAPDARQADLYGRTLSADGNTLGSQFGIDTSLDNQQGPIVGYTPKANRFIVGYQSWTRSPPDLNVNVVNPNGSVTKHFLAAKTASWEVPASITYHESTQTVLFSWLSASDAKSEALAREFDVSDSGGTAVAPIVLLSNEEPGPLSAAARPDSSDPQVFVLWLHGLGLDGIHGGFVHLTPPVPDLTAPAAVTDLAGNPGAPDLLIDPVTAIAVSGSSAGAVKENTTDGNPTTYWSTPTRSNLQTEQITWDVGSPRAISLVRLLSRASGSLFPVDYQIQLSLDGATFNTMFSVSGAAVPPGTWVEHDFPTASGRYVRLLVTKPAHVSSGYRTQLAEVEVYEAQSIPGTITLGWTAPGDDDNEGTAASYDARWSLVPITPSNFGTRTPISLPPPKLAGSHETATVSGLPDETRVYVALKTRDEASNLSALSNVAAVDTPGIPPAAVDDLVASGPTGSTVNLTWTATGDDGNTGPATAYDLRYAFAPINDGNFDQATPVAQSITPKAPGGTENFLVTGLPGETHIHFGIKVVDELGNRSPADTGPEPSATTLDTMAPARVTDLAVGPVSSVPVLLAAPAIASSGENRSSQSMEMATDGDLATYWSTPGRTKKQNEFITLDTGAPHNIGRVRLRSRSSGGLFPEDLEIQVSDDNVNFVTVLARTGLPKTAGIWNTLDFAPSLGRYLRVFITKPRVTGTGLYVVQIAEIEVYESPAVSGALTVTWTAPGDNDGVGQAAAYDLRWSLSTITGANFGSANPVTVPAPSPAGTFESVTVNGLPDETQVFFALVTRDEVPNSSPLSNVASGNTPGVAPAAVDDLHVTDRTGTSIELTWTAVGDNLNSGTATSYDLRYSTSPINAGNFDAATPFAVTPPIAAGGTEIRTVTGLSSQTTYFFALKVKDEVDNTSPIHSNGPVSGTTLDIVAPAAVTTLTGAPSPGTLTPVSAVGIAASGQSSGTHGPERATDGSLDSYWSSPARSTMQPEFITVDTGAAHNIGRVRLRSRGAGALFPEDLQIQVSNDNVIFTTLDTRAGLPATQGIWHQLDFTPGGGRYVRIYITKTRLSGGGTYIAQIAEIEVSEASPSNQVTLDWNATGDDLLAGVADHYDVRYSTAPISNANFASATSAGIPPAPLAPGTAQSMVVSGLAPDTTYYFAMKVFDEFPNASLLSNVVSVHTDP
jgi:hypothetical protein